MVVLPFLDCQTVPVAHVHPIDLIEGPKLPIAHAPKGGKPIKFVTYENALLLIMALRGNEANGVATVE